MSAKVLASNVSSHDKERSVSSMCYDLVSTYLPT